MYSIICNNRQAILDVIDQEDKKSQALSKYEWLVQNVKQVPWPVRNGYSFESTYADFWVFRGVTGAFKTEYFKELIAACNQPPTLEQLCTALCPFATRTGKTGQTIQTLQFSFPTKLCHTVDPHLPIYDVRVARFYLFQEPDLKLALPTRIKGYVEFYDFLKDEYLRVLTHNLLKPAIDDFRQRFNPQQHTDEKIIDWLIWAFIGWADNGALVRGRIVYA